MEEPDPQDHQKHRIQQIDGQRGRLDWPPHLIRPHIAKFDEDDCRPQSHRRPGQGMPIRTNWLMLGHQKQDQGAKEGHPVRDDQGEEWIDLARAEMW